MTQRQCSDSEDDQKLEQKSAGLKLVNSPEVEIVCSCSSNLALTNPPPVRTSQNRAGEITRLTECWRSTSVTGGDTLCLVSPDAYLAAGKRLVCVDWVRMTNVP